MNPIYFSFPLILIEMSLFLKKTIHLSYDGIDISIPINKTVITVLIILNSLFIFWIYKHMTKSLFKPFKLMIRDKYKKYLISLDAKKSQNLINNFGDVFKYKKDIYYIDGCAIIKTGNGNNDQGKYYDGYFIKINAIKHYFLITRCVISSVLDMEFFINCISIVSLVIFIPLLIIKKIM